MGGIKTEMVTQSVHRTVLLRNPSTYDEHIQLIYILQCAQKFAVKNAPPASELYLVAISV